MMAKLTRERPTTEQAEPTRLYRDNVRRAYGFVFHRVGPDDALDITADVFHAAALAYRTGNTDGVGPAWLMAVARNKVIDHWRRTARRKAKQHLAMTEERDLVEFPPDWSADHRRPAVVAALDELRPNHRSLLILHHVDGMPIAELAELLQKSERAVESALARARRAFRAAYDPGVNDA